MTQTSSSPAQLPWSNQYWLLNPHVSNAMPKGIAQFWPQYYIRSLVHCSTVWTINPLKNITTEGSLCLIWVSKTQDMPAQHYSKDVNAGQSKLHCRSQSTNQIWEGNPTQTFPESFHLLYGNSTIDKQLLDSIPGAVRAAQCPGTRQGPSQTFGSSAMKQVPCCQFSYRLPFKSVVTATCLY